MRISVAVLAASLTLALSPYAVGLENTPQQNLGSGTAEKEKPKPAPTRAERLDELFAALKAAPNEGAAKKAENGILSIWLESGSDTVDLMMAWTLKAIEDKDYPLALDFLDRIVTMKPDYAEGWNKRATVFYLTENYSQAVADIQRALIAEPRHFGALSGLGSILREIGADQKAMDAYNQALALDPYLDGVKKALGELHKETDGNDI